MGKVLNYQGNMIDPLNLNDACFNNIGMQCAVTLSRICRFWGQTITTYTVAQHCLSMVELFNGNSELQKWALAHEVYEALTGMDIPSPLKNNEAYAPYKKAEQDALSLFAQLYHMEPPLPNEIIKADKDLMVMEALTLMPKSNEVDWYIYGEPRGHLYKLGANESELRNDFLSKWVELFGTL